MINIADDTHIEALKVETTKMIKVLVHHFSLFVHELQSANLSRSNKQIIDAHDQELKQISVYSIKNEESLELTYFIDIFHGLQRLSLNDKTRLEMYQTQTTLTEVRTQSQMSFKHALKRMVFATNDSELLPMLKLIVQLTFNVTIAKDLSKEADLVGFLHKNVTRGDRPAELKKSSELILWNFKHSTVKGTTNRLGASRIPTYDVKLSASASSTNKVASSKGKILFIFF